MGGIKANLRIAILRKFHHDIDDYDDVDDDVDDDYDDVDDDVDDDDALFGLVI